MTLDAAAIAPSPSLKTPTSKSRQPLDIVDLTPEQRSTLTLQVHRHTPSAPISENVLTTFTSVINAAFHDAEHVVNFGDKQRYPTNQLLLDDLNHGEEGAWVFLLVTAECTAVAGAKITLSGEGMDGGPGVHTRPNPDYSSPHGADQLKTFWLGALGSISPGVGRMLIDHIKAFLSKLQDGAPFRIRAYTVAQWGVDPDYSIPQNASLPSWFKRQGFEVIDYSWKPPGTWQSFYGACLCAIEYVHAHSAAGGQDS
ncbi:hypothetical protein PSEUBRA_001995 [Kalmanozyma brasiliensis GHG001]|uniref:N-acetyltransferase domain-containing protein n=1 Tax=Kalmanozyma brasiliensis (strain GHG001) TaxID=1365824 RepID=V5EY40_KALBG|nr:uncharacterized protein PSEUBRA_001995 [Kalmanozyma brasiliensis GHG001]EST08568.1 hypothetical protein PSEUBRA_001995 [Kalmanozyma brasiliensis GHG001]